MADLRVFFCHDELRPKERGRVLQHRAERHRSLADWPWQRKERRSVSLPHLHRVVVDDAGLLVQPVPERPRRRSHGNRFADRTGKNARLQSRDCPDDEPARTEQDAHRRARSEIRGVVSHGMVVKYLETALIFLVGVW